MAISCVPESTRRHRLRDATRDSHKRVDDLVQAAGFLACRERYPAFLQGSWFARVRLERILDEYQAIRLFHQWPKRRIAELLRRDYRDVTGRDLDEIGSPPAAVPLLSSAELLGILYVLEGSSLGARLIARTATSMGFGPTWGARHLARQNESQDAWTSYLAKLEEYPMSDTDEERCVSAASQTFRLFEQAFEVASLT
jgi:heme oxygenase